MLHFRTGLHSSYCTDAAQHVIALFNCVRSVDHNYSATRPWFFNSCFAPFAPFITLIIHLPWGFHVWFLLWGEKKRSKIQNEPDIQSDLSVVICPLLHYTGTIHSCSNSTILPSLSSLLHKEYYCRYKFMAVRW